MSTAEAYMAMIPRLDKEIQEELDKIPPILDRIEELQARKLDYITKASEASDLPIQFSDSNPLPEGARHLHGLLEAIGAGK